MAIYLFVHMRFKLEDCRSLKRQACQYRGCRYSVAEGAAGSGYSYRNNATARLRRIEGCQGDDPSGITGSESL